MQLDAVNRCLLFADPRRPAVCGRFQADAVFCGSSRAQALQRLAVLEQTT